MGKRRTIFPVSYGEFKKNVFLQKCPFLLDSSVVDLTVNENSNTVPPSSEQNEVQFDHIRQNFRIHDDLSIINSIGNNNVASSSNNRYDSLRYNDMYNLELFSFVHFRCKAILTNNLEYENSDHKQSNSDDCEICSTNTKPLDHTEQINKHELVTPNESTSPNQR